jgi:hypothetical protein
MEEDTPLVVNAVFAQGGFPSFDSFNTVYNALPEERRPTSAPFYDSDVAFAARFLTASPLQLKKVTAVGDIPFDKSTIVGLNEIIAPNTFEGLITSGKMFLVDMSKFGLEASDHAPNSVIEAPIGLFFVASSNRLMPLAIKFTIQNTLTYSPKDSHADWFLAKAFFNLMDTTTNALVHFIDVHFVLSHICQSVTQSLAPEHPLTPLFTASCTNNDGVIQNGIPALLADGAAFDGLLAVSGHKIRYKLLTAAGSLYDWSKKGLDADLTARGVKTGVPNFDYATDATALQRIISTYVTSYVSSYYRTDARVGSDTELSTMIRKLSSSDSPVKIKGFPSSVTSVSSLAEIVTRVIFLAGVQHHALNSYNVQNYYHVYPQNPGKIPFVPPAKGMITDAVLKDSILMFGLPITSFLPFFLGTISLDYIFSPVLQANQRVDSSFCFPTADGKMDAFIQMRNSLNDLSNTIQARASRDAAAGLVPPYTALDPDNLLVGTTI